MKLFSGDREPIVLRPYQTKAVEDLRNEVRKGHKRLLLQAGTGSGKTVIAAEIIKNAMEKGKNVLFLAHRRELIDQCSDKLDWFGCEHGVIMAGRDRDFMPQTQVASIQTLWSRAVKREVMMLPPTDLIVLDECHRSMAPTYRKLLDEYEGCVVLGLTATPCRQDGRGLGNVYESMVRCPSVGELTREGFLVPVKYYAPARPDLKGVKVRMGDYVEGELAERMDEDTLVGNIVEKWGQLAEGRQTVVFATGVKHSIHIAEEFQRAGVRAAHLDGDTPMGERDEILRRLYERELDVVSNCMVLTEGWDCPPVSCCVLARPTKSLGLYLQMAGRTLRPWKGKTDTILIDHSGAVYEHGFLDQEIPWGLEYGDGGKITDEVKKRKQKEPKQITCPECQAVYISKPECPFCGWKPSKKGEEYEWVDGELVEVTAKGQKKWKLSEEYKKEFYRELVHVARKRGYKDGWAAYRYKKKFGNWPDDRWKMMEPKVAGPEVLAYVRHLQIRYAKAKEKERLMEERKTA